MDRPVLVSACLLGVACTHRGGAKAPVALGDTMRAIPVCPEVAGGLPTPRDAAERTADGRVVTESGTDVTDQYRRGAEHALAVARAAGVELAVLKARSPSCGSHEIYDGTHTGTLTNGMGVTAELLEAHGIRVISEEDLPNMAPPGA